MLRNKCGKNFPNSEGPTISPAAISPHTPGCPAFRKRAETTRAATMMTVNWRMTVDKLCSIAFFNCSHQAWHAGAMILVSETGEICELARALVFVKPRGCDFFSGSQDSREAMMRR